MADTESWFGNRKHEVNRKVIRNYSESLYPLDQLAVAFAYTGEGTKYRLEAIHFFEEYFKHPVPVPVHKNQYINGKPRPYFSQWRICTTLGNLYESEQIYDKAIHYFELAIAANGGENSSDYTAIGSIYEKQDINMAVQYYESLKLNRKVWKQHQQVFSTAYKNVLCRQKEGYTYRPRKRKKTEPTFDLAK